MFVEQVVKRFASTLERSGQKYCRRWGRVTNSGAHTHRERERDPCTPRSQHVDLPRSGDRMRDAWKVATERLGLAVWSRFQLCPGLKIGLCVCV